MASAVDSPRATAKDRMKMLTVSAEENYIDPAQGLVRYYRSSKTLYEAAKYEAEHGNNGKAYLLTMR